MNAGIARRNEKGPQARGIDQPWERRPVFGAPPCAVRSGLWAGEPGGYSGVAVR